MDKAYDVIESSIPLRPPIVSTDHPVFVQAMVRMLGDTNPMLRILSDSFEPTGVLRFISYFNGMTVTLPGRQYWTTVFRDAHIYVTLKATPKKIDEPAWRKAVLLLSRKYGLTPKMVVKISSKVKAAISKRGVYEDPSSSG